MYIMRALRATMLHQIKNINKYELHNTVSSLTRRNCLTRNIDDNSWGLKPSSNLRASAADCIVASLDRSYVQTRILYTIGRFLCQN